MDKAKMDNIVLKNSNGLDVEFLGAKLGQVSSRTSNDQKRWTELALYTASSGRYVCQQVGRSEAAGEYDIYKVRIAETVADVVEFFGSGWLSKQLYEQSGIQAREIIS